MIYTYYVNGSYVQFDITPGDIEAIMPQFTRRCAYDKRRKRYIYQGMSHTYWDDLLKMAICHLKYRELIKNKTHGTKWQDPHQVPLPPGSRSP